MRVQNVVIIEMLVAIYRNIMNNIMKNEITKTQESNNILVVMLLLVYTSKIIYCTCIYIRNVSHKARILLIFLSRMYQNTKKGFIYQSTRELMFAQLREVLSDSMMRKRISDPQILPPH